MTKNELVHELASRTGLDCKECMAAVNGISEIIRDEMSRHNEVVLRGFGNFKVVNRKSHKGINLSTGDIITIPARNVVKFFPSKNLNEKVI